MSLFCKSLSIEKYQGKLFSPQCPEFGWIWSSFTVPSSCSQNIQTVLRCLIKVFVNQRYKIGTLSFRQQCVAFHLFPLFCPKAAKPTSSADRERASMLHGWSTATSKSDFDPFLKSNTTTCMSGCFPFLVYLCLGCFLWCKNTKYIRKALRLISYNWIMLPNLASAMFAGYK